MAPEMVVEWGVTQTKQGFTIYPRVRPQTNTEKVIGWITRMSLKYGGIVYGYGKTWDWGQALCVEQCGLDPDTWDGEDGRPTDEDVARAQRWEAGDWPDWVEKTMTDWPWREGKVRYRRAKG